MIQVSSYTMLVEKVEERAGGFEASGLHLSAAARAVKSLGIEPVRCMVMEYPPIRRPMPQVGDRLQVLMNDAGGEMLIEGLEVLKSKASKR